MARNWPRLIWHRRERRRLENYFGPASQGRAYSDDTCDWLDGSNRRAEHLGSAY